MKAVLISIQPPHTTNIFDEIKGIEWRTKPMPTGKHYVYETKNGGGIGKVIGECTIWRVHKYDKVSLIPESHIDAGCVPYEFLEQYAKGKPLYAHFIVNPKRYDKPKELEEFRKSIECHRGKERHNCFGCWDCEITRPPQSWFYVETTPQTERGE